MPRLLAGGRPRLGTPVAIMGLCDPQVRRWRAALSHCYFLFILVCRWGHDSLAAGRRAPAASSASASAPVSASFFLLRLGHGSEGVVPAARKIAHTDEHWHYTDNVCVYVFETKECECEAIGPQTFCPQAFGLQAIGPQTFCPQAFGPQAIGPQTFCPQALLARRPIISSVGV